MGKRKLNPRHLILAERGGQRWKRGLSWTSWPDCESGFYGISPCDGHSALGIPLSWGISSLFLFHDPTSGGHLTDCGVAAGKWFGGHWGVSIRKRSV